MDVVRKKRKPMSEINVVPYVDVMLVLLVIFMVTAPLMNQGIEVELPQANNGPLPIDETLETLVISVTSAQEYFISLGATAEDQEPVSLDLIGEQVSIIMNANPSIQVLIEGDARAEWSAMISLITTLQSAGVESPNFITQPIQDL